MKPHNFPGNKNRRRLNAFSRLPRTLVNLDEVPDHMKKRAASVKVEAASLANSILTSSTARSTRTKKNRANQIFMR